MVANILSLLAVLPVALALSGRSPAATKKGNVWVLADAGSFTKSATYTFTGSSLPAGLYASAYTVNDPDHYGHQFTTANAYVSGGYLNLKVPGGQTKSPLTGAEIGTTDSKIRYASVRTTAVLGGVAGSCNGFFTYKDDTQETDIEFISDPKSLSNPGDGSRPLFLTNQANDGVFEHRTHGTVASPSDATSAENEYRIDWLPGVSRFYVNGKLVKTYTTNVPSVASSFLWNNWANGDPGWTGVLPASDNLYKISKIEMYYNTTA